MMRWKFFLLLFWFAGSVLGASTGEELNSKILQLTSKAKPAESELDSANALFKVLFNSDYPGQSTLNTAKLILDACIRAEYDGGSALAYQHLCKVYLGAGMNAEAMQSAFSSLDLFTKLGNSYEMGIAHMNIGIAYFQLENFTESIEHYREAIKLFRQSGNSEKTGTVLYLLGIDYNRLGKTNLAKQCFLDAIAHHDSLNDQQGIAECQIQIGDMLISMNEPDEAMSYIFPALIYSLNEKEPHGEALAKELLSRAFLQKNQPDSALKYALSAKLLADSLGALMLQKDISRSLYQIYKTTGKQELAIFWLETFMSYKDSILNDKNSRLIAQLETQQMLAKKQNEILLLEKENKNNELRFKGSIIIGLMFLLLFIVLYSRYIIRQRANRELSHAYDNLRKTQEQLISHEKMASLGQLTAGIAHEIKNPLNFVNNFSQLSMELTEELKNASSESERNEIIEELNANLEMIGKHGKRADSIVKNMLDHSRTGNSEKEKHDINKLCSEYLNLSFQGTRAQFPGFSCDLKVTLAPEIPLLNIAGQEISRVLINIFNNAFYALHKKSLSTPGFIPEISLNTEMKDNFAVITIRDNGTGIPKKVKDKIFEPFFTTKPSGEGTGLGLSISYDIINSHGGKMDVESEEGQYTRFTIRLPLS